MASGVRWLRQEDLEVARSYGVVGTPTAYLIDREMRTAAPVAIGPDAVVRLTDVWAGRRRRDDPSE